MSSTSTGRDAERYVADQLHKDGYKLLNQNWRTRMCEIDLVMKKSDTVYFIEVKYRRTDTHGGGLEYITPKKLQQMHFAAEMWAAQHKWEGDMRLAACEVSGNFSGSPDLLII